MSASSWPWIIASIAEYYKITQSRVCQFSLLLMSDERLHDPPRYLGGRSSSGLRHLVEEAWPSQWTWISWITHIWKHSIIRGLRACMVCMVNVVTMVSTGIIGFFKEKENVWDVGYDQMFPNVCLELDCRSVLVQRRQLRSAMMRRGSGGGKLTQTPAWPLSPGVTLSQPNYATHKQFRGPHFLEC